MLHQDQEAMRLEKDSLGYDAVARQVEDARQEGSSISAQIVKAGIASRETVNRLFSARNLCKLCFTPEEFEKVNAS